MQTEKGVTLISVTIYIIVMLIIVTVITVLTSYFYQNVDINSVSEDFNIFTLARAASSGPNLVS